MPQVWLFWHKRRCWMNANLSILILSSKIASQCQPCPEYLPYQGSLQQGHNVHSNGCRFWQHGGLRQQGWYCKCSIPVLFRPKISDTYDSHDRKGVFMVHTPRGVVESHCRSETKPWGGLSLVNDTDIDDNPPQADSSPDHQLHITTVRQNFESHTKNKSNKLHAPATSWAWLPVPPNAISKPWYISICLKTALSQTTTFAMLTTFMALTLHQSEARRSGRNLSEW